MSLLDLVGSLSVPLTLAACSLILLISKTDLSGVFLDGVKEGLQTAFSLLPGLIILLCGVRMFAASGALAFLGSHLAPLFSRLGISPPLLQVVLMRPFSGSASTASINELFAMLGPDSRSGLIASVLLGSSDTILYTLSVYFSAVGVRRTRYALPAAFLVLLFCLLVSVLLTNLFFPAAI